MLKKEDIKDFIIAIEHGCFYWKIKLIDNNVYQIKYKMETYITPAGNKSKRKIYFIKKDNKELIFDDEVKRMFFTFRIPYIRCGI